MRTKEAMSTSIAGRAGGRWLIVVAVVLALAQLVFASSVSAQERNVGEGAGNEIDHPLLEGVDNHPSNDEFGAQSGRSVEELLTTLASGNPQACWDETPTILASQLITLGTPGDDVILAVGTGQRIVLGQGGNDLICVGENDVALGGLGDDRIMGLGGSQLVGEDGDDFISGRGADIRIFGLAGDDVLEASQFPGTPGIYIDGGAGSDRITGTHSYTSDSLFGGDGDDWIYAKKGDDFVDGGNGTDECDPGWGNDELINCEIDFRQCLNARATIVGTPGVSIVGTSGDDVIVGTEGDDNVNGGAGDDKICTGPGSDNVDGGAGDDFVDGGDENDNLRGGTGADVVLGQNGNDQLRGDQGNDVLFGHNGSDTVDGGSGDDELFGLAGNDRLFGDGPLTGEVGQFGGDDTILGGTGDDHIDGNDGYDACDGEEGDNELLNCEAFGS